MNRNITLELTKHSGFKTRTVALETRTSSRDANHSSRLYPAWSHNCGSVAMRCAIVVMSRAEARVAMTSHMPELSAATRNVLARLRPESNARPKLASSTVSRNPNAELASQPSDIDSTSASRKRNGNGLRRYATSVSVSKTEQPLSTNSFTMENFCADTLCDPTASFFTRYDATARFPSSS